MATRKTTIKRIVNVRGPKVTVRTSVTADGRTQTTSKTIRIK